MAAEFDTRGVAARFPPTRVSAVAALGSDDAAVRARAFEALVAAYWRPVYAHVRLRWRRDPEESSDVVQDFFARALDKQHFSTFDPARARFRTYLKGALDYFVRDRVRAEKRERRGGGLVKLSLDFELAEKELAASAHEDLDACFEREWARGLFRAAIVAFEARCKEEGKTKQLALFRRYVLDPELEADAARPSYALLARELEISVTDVTNHLAWARRTFRASVLEALREVTASEDEWREEARALLGEGGAEP